MPGSKTVADIGLYTIRVEPGMQLHPPLMTLFDEERQRVEGGIVGYLSLFTGKKTAPGLQLGTIEGIGFGAHLEDHRVDTGLIKFADHLTQVVSHGSTVHLAVTRLPHGLYPDTAKLPLGRFKRNTGRQTTCGSTGGKHQQQQQ